MQLQPYISVRRETQDFVLGGNLESSQEPGSGGSKRNE